MTDFKLIGVQVFNGEELTNTHYFKIGEITKAIEYSNRQENKGNYCRLIACNKYGCYICKL